MIKEHYITPMDDELSTAPLEVGESEDNPKKPKKKFAYTKTLIYFSIVIVLTGLSLFLALNGNVQAIGESFSMAKWYFIILAVAVVFLSFCVRSFIYFCFAHLYTKHYSYSQALALDQVGIFYSAVTPLNTGGQFVQVYTMKKQGIATPSAVSIFVMYSVMYEIILILYGIVSFTYLSCVYGSAFFNLTVDLWSWHIPMWALAIYGFVCNIGYILIIFLLTYWKGFLNFIAGPCVNILAKMRLLKHPEKTSENLRIQMENYRLEFRRLFTNIPFTILVAVLLIVFFTITFSMPYFTGLCLGNTTSMGTGVSGFFNSVFLTNFHQLVSGVIPIPGSAGVSELIFNGLFYDSVGSTTNFYDTEAMCSSAMILWRSMTFTIPLFIAGIISVFYKASPKEEVNKQMYGFRNAYREVQIETTMIRKEEFDEFRTHRLSPDEINEQMKNEEAKNNHDEKYFDQIIDSSPYTNNREDDD